MRSLRLALLLLLMAAPVAAQTVTADRFQFKTGPCTLRSGTGSPEGAVVGKICDTWWRTDTGQIYTKTSGTGNTGWTLPGGVSGTGTTNSLAKWTNSSTIGNASITDDAATVTVMPTGNVVFNNGGDLVFNPTGNDVLPTTGYDINIGALTNKFLALHAAELWVETLVAQNTMATIGGRILVAPTTLLTADLTTGATSIIVKHNNLASGDRVYLEANGDVEFLAITNNGSGAGPYTYTVTRNLDGTGANAWAAGDAILNTGQTGNGFLDLYSVRGVKAGTEIGPTIVGNVRNSATYNDWSPRFAIGNLNGLYGYSGSTYGSVFGTPGGARIMIDATNGVRIVGGDNDTKVTIDTSGNATFDGNLTVGVGTNMLRNSECRASAADWVLNHTTGLTTTLAFGLSPWRLLDELNTCYIDVAGTPASSTVGQAYSNFVAAEAGQVWETSVYLGNHGTTNTTVFLQFVNASLATITVEGGTMLCAPADGTGGVSLSGYCRAGAIATAPANTSAVRMFIHTVYAGGIANPKTFFVRAYLGEGKVGQEDLSEWTAPGLTEIIGGIILTNSITTRELAADSVIAENIDVTNLNAVSTQTGSLNVDGTLTVGTGGAILSGATTYTAGTGFWLDYNAANPRFRIGNPAGNRLNWDGTTLTIVGNGSGITSINGGNIQTNTITATQIDANAVDTSELNANAVTAGKINVGTLSAISANLGTINAGSITGVTAVFGSGGEVSLNNSGIQFTAGTGTNNQIKFSDGAHIASHSSYGGLYLNGGSNGIALASAASGVSLSLQDLTGSGTNRFVCHNNGGTLYSSAGTCDGSTPAPVARVDALEQQVELLKQELAALRAELAALRAPQQRHP